MTQEAAPPVLRIITPDASAEEVAALVAVFAALDGGAGPAPEPISEWASPRRRIGGALHSGRGVWRASGLPR